MGDKIDFEKMRVPKGRCLNCGHLLTGAADKHAQGGAGPGDVSICVYCSHLMVFDDEMRLREPTDAEIREIAGDPELVQAMLYVHRARAERPRETDD